MVSDVLTEKGCRSVRNFRRLELPTGSTVVAINKFDYNCYAYIQFIWDALVDVPSAVKISIDTSCGNILVKSGVSAGIALYLSVYTISHSL